MNALDILLRFGNVLPKFGLTALFRQVGAAVQDTVGVSSGPVQPGRGYTGDGSTKTIAIAVETTDAITADSTLVPTCSVNGTLILPNGVAYGTTITRAGAVVAYLAMAEGSGAVCINSFVGAGALPHGTISTDTVHTEILDGTGFDLNIAGFSANENRLPNSEDLTKATWVKKRGETTQSASLISVIDPTNPNLRVENPWIATDDVVGVMITARVVGLSTSGMVVDARDGTSSTVIDLDNEAYTSYRHVVAGVGLTLGVPFVDFTFSHATQYEIIKAQIYKPTTGGIGNIVAIGDSYIAGDIAPLSQKYVPDYTVIDAGVAGETLREIAARSSAVFAANPPSKVYIQAGTNSVLNYSDTLEQMKAAFIEIVTNARIAGADQVISGNVPPSSVYNQAKRDLLAAYNSWHMTYCSDNDVYLVNTNLLLGDGDALSAAYNSDDVHPNQAGYEVLCKQFTRLTVVNIRYIKTDSYPIAGFQPAVSPTLDALGNSLQYPGRLKYTPEIVSGTSQTDWIITLPQAPELINILGLDSDFYDALGVPKQLTWAALMAYEGPVTFGCEERDVFAIYDPALTGTNLTKANTYYKVAA